MIPDNKILGGQQIPIPRSAVEARRKTSSVTILDLYKSERLMVIAL